MNLLKKIVRWIGFTVLCFVVTAMHPIKMSFGQLKLDDGNKYELTQKFFLDDLSMFLCENYRLQKVAFTSLEDTGVEVLQDYFNQNLYVTIKQEKFLFTIKEVTVIEKGTVLLVKSETSKIEQPQTSIFLYNRLLFDVFSNQVNVVKYKKNTNYFKLRTPKIKIDE